MLQRLNACRLFLQVILLSKIVIANGKDIKNNILKGKRNSIESNKLWPRQKSTDTATWNMWKSILKKTFYSYENHLQSKFQLRSLELLTLSARKEIQISIFYCTKRNILNTRKDNS